MRILLMIAAGVVLLTSSVVLGAGATALPLFWLGLACAAVSALLLAAIAE